MYVAPFTGKITWTKHTLVSKRGRQLLYNNNNGLACNPSLYTVQISLQSMTHTAHTSNGGQHSSTSLDTNTYKKRPHRHDYNTNLAAIYGP